MKLKLSEEMAVRLHRMMWSDMQKELGNDPDEDYRLSYKRKWIKKHFGEGIEVANSCFLCDYAGQFSDYELFYCGSKTCGEHCPIQWPGYNCTRSPKDGGVHYGFSPISEILALPARNEKLTGLETEYIANDIETVAVAICHYKYREQLLSKASGIAATLPIEDHVKAIREKAVQQSTFSKMYCDAKTELAKTSGLPEANTITDHIKAIQKKASDETRNDLVKELAEVSGVPVFVDIWRHIKMIQEKAVDEYFEKQPAAKLVSMDVDDAFKQYAEEQMEPLRDKLDKYKDALSKQSGLDRNRPVDDHIREIVKNSMDTGANDERDRIQEKIYEVLLS